MNNDMTDKQEYSEAFKAMATEQPEASVDAVQPEGFAEARDWAAGEPAAAETVPDAK